MQQHLTDIACLEWVRHKKVALAPETTYGVETHLAGCAQCRQKVADFNALERSFHPWGSAMRKPLPLRIGSALKVAAVALGVLALALLAVAAF